MWNRQFTSKFCNASFWFNAKRSWTETESKESTVSLKHLEDEYSYVHAHSSPIYYIIPGSLIYECVKFSDSFLEVVNVT